MCTLAAATAAACSSSRAAPGLLVPNIASALGCFLFRQFFLSAPVELGAPVSRLTFQRLEGAQSLA